MNQIQQQLVQKVKESILLKHYGETFKDNYEIKTFEVTETHFSSYRGKEKTLVFIIVETGMKGDEGTMAAVFARTRRHLLIKERGGVELLNAKVKSKKHGWFNAYHALTN